MVSIIIPAYNEGRTIGGIVRAVIGHRDVREVIVVDDGSTDDTAFRANDAGARVIRIEENRGKANAMDMGVKEAVSDIVLFLDADVLGFTHEKISTIIDPVISKRLEMHVGIIDRPKLVSKKVFYVLPVLSGLRALTKSLWYKVPREHRDGFKIELALNHAARKWGKGTGYELIGGLEHVIKEKKHGLLKGLWFRARMVSQILYISFILYIWQPIKLPFAWLRKAVGLELN